MADEENIQTGVNEQIPVAGESTGVEQTPAAEGQEVVGTGQEQVAEQTVPYERFAEVNAQKNELQQQLGIYQAQLQSYVGQQQPGQVQQPVGAVADPLEGTEDYETMTVGQYKAARQQTLAQMQRMAADQQFLIAHPDYKDVVGAQDNATGIFMPAAPMLQAINKNPLLVNLIQSSPNPMLAAYTFAKQEKEAVVANASTPEQQAANSPQMSPAAAEALARQNVPGSASQAGTAGGFNAANRIANMTAEEFAAHKEKVKAKG